LGKTGGACEGFFGFSWPGASAYLFIINHPREGTVCELLGRGPDPETPRKARIKGKKKKETRGIQRKRREKEKEGFGR